MRLFYAPAALLVAATLSACSGSMFATTPVQYDIVLDEVERPGSSGQRYSERQVTRQDSAGIARYVYEDSLINIMWLPTASNFNFVLRNKTANSMKLNWDEAAFVTADGESKRVMHVGVKFIDRNNSMPPSTIVRGGKLEDLVYPSDNVYYVEGRYGGWRERPIFAPDSYMGDNVGKAEPAMAHKGKRVAVLLPLEVRGVVNEYLFTFLVRDVVIPQPKRTLN